MTRGTTADATVHVRASNVGGIDETEVELDPGVNVLTGRNASNRTSFLQALMAALGSDRVSLKGDADAGRVELTIGESTYTRTIERRNGQLHFDGAPYVDDPTLADLFAFLLESNEARQAVARGDDLREIIMRPVDTAAIQAEIETLESEIRSAEAELEERDRLRDERDSLAAERSELDERVEETRTTLESRRAEIDAADDALEASREREAELESALAELRDRRSTLEDVRFRIETGRETIESLRTELETVESALADDDGEPTTDVDSLDERIEQLRRRRQRLDSRRNQLQSLIQFNEEALDGESAGGLDFMETPSESAGDVTDRLLESGDAFVCWTCGEETKRAAVEETLERLRDRRTTFVERRSELDDELDAATDRKQAIIERERRRAEREQRRTDLEAELATVEEEVETLEDRRERLAEEADRQAAAVESLRESAYDEIIDLHTAANELELELDRLESERDRTTERLQTVEDRLEELAALDDERSMLRTRLEERRTRIERLEDEAVAAFNEHMSAVLDVLEYENIARIWIERTEREVRSGRRTERRAFFDLHVVRNATSGAVYEDTVDHLSESEREVTGLVFALAGFLAHDVGEALPFVLLDSIEAIDADRIARLVEYLAERTPYLVVALLPEDAAPLDERHRRITAI